MTDVFAPVNSSEMFFYNSSLSFTDMDPERWSTWGNQSAEAGTELLSTPSPTEKTLEQEEQEQMEVEVEEGAGGEPEEQAMLSSLLLHASVGSAPDGLQPEVFLASPTTLEMSILPTVLQETVAPRTTAPSMPQESAGGLPALTTAAVTTEIPKQSMEEREEKEEREEEEKEDKSAEKMSAPQTVNTAAPALVPVFPTVPEHNSREEPIEPAQAPIEHLSAETTVRMTPAPPTGAGLFTSEATTSPATAPAFSPALPPAGLTPSGLTTTTLNPPGLTPDQNPLETVKPTEPLRPLSPAPTTSPSPPELLTTLSAPEVDLEEPKEELPEEIPEEEEKKDEKKEEEAEKKDLPGSRYQ
ncbi:mucin-2-like [Periophthalmus magnuspinnatus]|uniref:mucin-2-like n=1 Tax=Periophthalmus magnuspinnatus TaxID=409849 RepID=UPI0024371BB1|nr:mucin-2-like [Periophthalmus magnuspinnatus]